MSSVVAASVLAGWFVLLVVFLARKRGDGAPARQSDRRSLLGMALEGVGFAMVWGVRRPRGELLPGTSVGVEAGLGVATVILMAASVWLVASAVRTLGKQWSLTARVMEGHALIQTGPYRLVRNPIYSGMLGMLLATGLAFSRWWCIAAGAVVFLLGTLIRVASEERLLRQEFGAEFDAYAADVPALLPRWPRG
jgi:protein-S-isoprenylcysteine O-methyltransferase Ste14